LALIEMRHPFASLARQSRSQGYWWKIDETVKAVADLLVYAQRS
jgi:transposase-like protein